MRLLRQQPSILFWGIATVCTVLLVLGACNSPRRIVISGPGITPSPTETPTPIVSPSGSPTPIPTVTPIPTSTPFGMATPVPRKDAPAQFLFTVSPDSQLMIGFRINEDGSLAPVAGSPFVTSMPMRFAVSVHGALIVASKDTIFAFAVDNETGMIQQTSAFQTGAISQLMTNLPGDMVLAATQAGAIPFLVSNGKLMALPGQMTALRCSGCKRKIHVCGRCLESRACSIPGGEWKIPGTFAAGVSGTPRHGRNHTGTAKAVRA
jgi:hypothetical protein